MSSLPLDSQRHSQRKRILETDSRFSLARDEHKRKSRCIGSTGLARALGTRSHEDDGVLLKSRKGFENEEFQKHTPTHSVGNGAKIQNSRVLLDSTKSYNPTSEHKRLLITKQKFPHRADKLEIIDHNLEQLLAVTDRHMESVRMANKRGEIYKRTMALSDSRLENPSLSVRGFHISDKQNQVCA
ncbi:hypothetical protein AOQ84DRAFT_152641 [Glonium stellatum]|uniref:Uncharacterized protein n=1 Tax=Glonium stellatum TaxID=574774 RepID=A0A8E2FD90_9PEZI|nr:hypothetical protein AOQ84DRAFT_152641 [Glonium stellatum]